MRSRSSIQSVSLQNWTNEEGSYVSLKVEINSWVSLKPEKTGGHAKDAAKYGGTGIRGSYKAKVVDFRMSPGGRAVTAVRIQHAYMRHHLNLDNASAMLHPSALRCNYLYLSDFWDWVHPTSILGLIFVIHAEIGELTRGTRSHSELLNDSVFFYNAKYKPRCAQSIFGELQSISLPSFDSPEWPLPDMATTESFRAKMRLDFHNSMRPTTSSKQTNLSWFMPIGVFVDLFYVSTNMHRTSQMFIYKHVTEELSASLMDNGWNEKITRIRDKEFVKTTVPLGSLKFRYHISRSTLYANFVYTRYKMQGDKTWEVLDQYQPVETVVLQCKVEDIIQDLEVGMAWSVHEIRQEIEIQFGELVDFDFDIWIMSDTGGYRVNPRNEKNVAVFTCRPPKKLRVVQWQ